MAYMCTNKHLAKGATYLKLQMFPIPLGSTEFLVLPRCQDVVQRSLDERYIHDTTKLGTHTQQIEFMFPTTDLFVWGSISGFRLMSNFFIVG